MLLLKILQFSSMLLVTTATCVTYSSCTMNCDYKATSTQLSALKLTLYGNNFDNYTEAEVGNALDLMNKTDPAKSCFFFSTGWVGPSQQNASRSIITEIIKLGIYNVFRLNWDSLCSYEYLFVSNSLEDIACSYSMAVEKMIGKNLNASALYCVGHSLGAHLCGYFGKNLKSGGHTLSRITGLDPAGPNFNEPRDCLSPTDADTVDAIGTDRGGYGTERRTGSVQFYPNNGTNVQPGCEVGSNTCSHLIVLTYYARSIPANIFLGRRCDSYSSFKSGSYISDEMVPMGFGTPPNAIGDIYLQTSSQDPYGKGESGATYENSNSPATSLMNSIG